MHSIGTPSHLKEKLRTLARSMAVAAALLTPLALAAQQATFPTPEAAVDALASALKANSDEAIVRLFGEKFRNLVGTGDPASDAARRNEASEALALRKRLEEVAPDRRILRMGARDWPFPVPIVRDGPNWRFASEQGAEEILNRRIGANERNAIYVLRAVVDAQRKYVSKDYMGDGVLQYARRLGSRPGRQDGLYWESDPAGEREDSPLGPLVAAAAKELAGRKEGEPYYGYRFRILTGQGSHAKGGAFKYVINGRMIAGFGAVAYPAEWGRSGVMTFIVNQNGKVFQKNLGPKPPAVTTFDPGPGWTEVPPES
jgi:hypothetical protein